MSKAPIVVLMASSLASVHAQPPPAFEAASVRRNISDESETTWRVPAGGIMTITNATARALILIAYEIPLGLQRFLLVDDSNSPVLRGEPVVSVRSPGTPRFDVQGKIPEGAAPGQQFEMLRTLLAERFKLRAHKEMRPVPVYALRVARAGRLGSGLRPSTADCIEFRRQRFQDPAVQEPRGPDGLPLCSTPPFPVEGTLTIRNAGPITQLIRDLQGRADRPIIDETGLSTGLEWVLKWETATSATAPLTPTAMYAALEDQLGLKLERHTAPLEVLVIESIEMPTEN